MLEIGIDIGGTFTDFALVDHERRTIGTAKTLTTPQDPVIGVLQGLREVLDRRGLALSDLGRVAHGTTLITNAVLERRGARVGLLTNAGFGDILFIGKEQRYDIADLRLRFPAPLVARCDVIEIGGRLDRHGREREPLDLEAVANAARRLAEAGVEAIAVCFINAYVDGRHEVAARDTLRAAGLDLPVCLSSEIAPRAKEYERFTTTVINAYTLPATDRYLSRLDSALRDLGFAGRVDVMAANGGCLPIAIARQFPVRLIESGPAAGAIMAASVARDLGARTALAFDMGGTTAKGTLIRGGQLAKEDEFEVAHVHKFKPGSGMPLLIPVVDMIEIGSGGGSIAGLDDRGVVVVGPRSAGAQPGPACYALGGEAPTLTDANVALGYLPAETFANSRLRLEPARAERALLGAFGGLERESLSLTDIALAIHDKASEDVAKAFRVHCARRGADLEEGLMVAFGGSGPLQACSVAEKIGIGHICFPNGAGVFSAIGLVFAPRSYEYSRTLLLEVDPGRPQAIKEAWSAIHAACCGLFGFDADDPRAGHPVTTLAMRYRGQGYELPISRTDVADLSPNEVREAFETRYRALNGFAFADTPVEIVHWRIEIAHSEARSFADYAFEREAVSVPTRGLLALGGHHPIEAPRLRRSDLVAGGEASGPLLIIDDDTTIFIPAAFTARADRLGNVFATRTA